MIRIIGIPNLNFRWRVLRNHASFTPRGTMVVFHGEEGGWGAAQKGQEDEGAFGDSPFVLAGFGFIGGVGEVGDDVDQ